ncbi:TolC family protein [Chryseolinea sp. T2]|uniref:TolC family protein n=1 Tax=Chryseolinea sp. T2 TaxID=3129255 RepID=UPI003078964F
MRYLIAATLIFCGQLVAAQPQKVTLEQAMNQAVQINKSIQAADLGIEYQRQLKRTSTDIGKTNVVYMRGQYNSFAKDDNNVTISQSIPFPTVFATQSKLNQSLIKGSELHKSTVQNELMYQVKQAFYELVYLKAKESLLRRQDSIYQNFARAADARYRAGETNLLEKTTAETQSSEVTNKLNQTRADVTIYQQLLGTLINNGMPMDAANEILQEREFDLNADTVLLKHNPQLAFLKQQTEIAEAERKVAGAKFLPDILVGYFNQTLIGTPANSNGDLATHSDRFQGFEIGLSVPLWFGPQSAKVKAASINEQRAGSVYEYNQTILKGQWQQAIQQYAKSKSSLAYYQTAALQNAELILKQSELAFRNGEIDYMEFLLSTRSAIQIRENFLISLNDVNQSIIYLEFLAGSNNNQ